MRIICSCSADSGSRRHRRAVGISDFWINDDWYDDVSDGPVSATITLRATSASPPVVGAWVIVAPPKFAPDIDNVITLYDRVFQAMVDGGLATEPTTTSYTNDVFPILQRARDTRLGGVHRVSALHGPTRSPASRCGRPSSTD